MLDEATARATAIHDGAERRLNLLSTRHAETVRRLTDILDGVQGLVAAEAARMSLEEEVNQSVSRAVSLAEAADAANAAAEDDGPRRRPRTLAHARAGRPRADGHRSAARRPAAGRRRPLAVPRPAGPGRATGAAGGLRSPRPTPSTGLCPSAAG